MPLKKLFSTQNIAFLIIFILGISFGIFKDEILPKSWSDKKVEIGLVNGKPILIEELNALLKDRFENNAASFDGLNPKSQEIIFNDAANIKIFAAEARKLELHKTADFKHKIAFYTEKSLKDAYFKSISEKPVTDEQLKEKYEKMVAEIQGKLSLNYSQIVITSKDKADTVIKKLKSVKSEKTKDSFASLAKKYSIDTISAARGGTMKQVNEASIDPNIATMVKNTPIDHYSSPFQVQDKWYIVMKESSEPIVPLPLDNVKEIIKNSVINDRTKDAQTEVLKANEIVYHGLNNNK